MTTKCYTCGNDLTIEDIEHNHKFCSYTCENLARYDDSDFYEYRKQDYESRHAFNYLTRSSED